MEKVAGEVQVDDVQEESLVYDDTEEVEEEKTEGTEEVAAEETTETTEPTEEAEVTEEKDSKEEGSKELSDEVQWVKKRLSRQKRADEREFLDHAMSMSEGVSVSKEELPSAVRLWNLLKHNEKLNSEVTEVISKAFRSNAVKELHEISGVTKDVDKENALAVREAKLDLKTKDITYRKYESQILEWAEDEGLSISKPEDLKRVYREWKGENAQKLMVKAEQLGTKKAQLNTQTKEKAALQSSARSIGKPKPMDYKSASDADILKKDNLKLFITDD